MSIDSTSNDRIENERLVVYLVEGKGDGEEKNRHNKEYPDEEWREFVDDIQDEKIADEVRHLNRLYDSRHLALDDFLGRVEKKTDTDRGKLAMLINNQGKGAGKNIVLIRFIAELHKNYKISLLSNIGSNWIRESFLEPDEQALFDDMVLSFEVGITKPDPQIFKLACQRLNVTPKEAIFVDDVAAYCEVAGSLGMRSIVYDNFSKMKQELEQLIQ